MNIEKLLDEVDAVVVAEYIDMEIIEKGTTKCIYCPGHERRLHKPDVHIGNAYLRKKGYVCHSCGGFFPVHEMVMDFAGCSSDEAYVIMAEAMGGVEFYSDMGESQSYIPKLKLSNYEAKVLGITPKFSVVVDRKPIESETILIKEGLFSLFGQNEKMYYQIIADRAREMLEKYQFCMEHYASAHADKAYELYDLMGDTFDRSVYGHLYRELSERIDTCRKILSIFSSKLQHS